MKLSIALVIVLGLAFVSAEEGFFYGSPALGTIQLANKANLTKVAVVFDTKVARPSAVCANNNNQVLFSNNAPPLYWPFISQVDMSGDNPADLMFSSENTPPGVAISAMAYDDYSDQVFFMYEELNPNKKPFANQIYGAIQRYSQGDNGPIDVYTLNVSAKVPNSFDINAQNQTVYYSTNGVVVGDQRSFGGIYSINYSGENTRLEVNIPELNSTAYSVSSVQYADDHLFYILKSPFSSAIYKYHLEQAEIEMIYNGTLFVPKQIVTVVDSDNGDTNIWVRDISGNFYNCIDEACDDVTGPVATVHNGAEILDFDVSGDESSLFYVGASFSSVIEIDTSSGTTSSLVNGISSSTNMWASSVDDVLYYSGNERIDSVDSDSNWNNFAKFSFSVDLMTGDASTGQVIIASRQTGGIYFVETNGSETLLVDSATTAIAAQDGVLYYAVSDDQYGYEAKILSCNISNCIPSLPVDQVTLPISSLTIDTDGNLFYSTADGIFQSQSGPEPAVSYQENITPFALAFDAQNETLYFLDIDIKKGDYTIVSCKTTNCDGTMTKVATLSVAAGSGKFELNGWMIIDSVGENLYWAASSLVGDIYKVEIASRTNSLLFASKERINGIALASDDNSLFVSDGKMVNQYDIVSDIGSSLLQCSVSSSTVGNLAINGDTLIWSDSSSGTVFDCLADCSNCNTSVVIDTGYPSCSPWQFITVDQNEVYNQLGCGGIERAEMDGSESTTLKLPGLDPIADLVVQNTSLIWALPYRYEILRADISVDAVSDSETFYSGTGTFANLIANDGVFYWIDAEAAKIMQAVPGSPATNLIYQPAVGLTYISVEAESPSVSPVPTPSLTNSTTPTPTISASASPTILASSSASSPPTPTTSNTTVATPTRTIQTTPSSLPSVPASMSIVQNVSASVSLTNSTTPLPASPSPLPSSASMSPQANITTSNSTMSTTPSGTVTPTLSGSNSSTPSVTGSNTPTISITSSTTSTGTATLSVGASVSPTVSDSTTHTATASVTPSNFLYGSSTNTPGLPDGYTNDDEPVITRTMWEWIVVVLMFIVVLCIIPGLYCCWKRGVEREMAMSLRLPDE